MREIGFADGGVNYWIYPPVVKSSRLWRSFLRVSDPYGFERATTKQQADPRVGRGEFQFRKRQL